ncbi:MAG TPA: PHP domain-containing protein [Candidatus Saccharimonadales bacterium]|nr:PHP domain-containing protein [Candidatus Saccharimonadales bacterium]
MLKIDLHTHTWASPDGGLLPKHFETVFARGLLDYVAVTDHNTITAAQQIQRRFGKRIIVGEEISTREGDLIGLYLTQAVPAGLNVREAAQRIKAQGGLVYVPHPFERLRKSGGTTMLAVLSDIVDILETHNGRIFLRRPNDLAAAYAAQHALPAAASSDAHGFVGWGNTYTTLPEPPTRDTLCALLSDATFSKGRPGARMLLYPTVNRLRKRLNLPAAKADA